MSPALLRPCLGLLLGLALAAPARAALDPEVKTPYELQIVLHVADNRALTPLFQEQLARALADQLRQTFGALARIEVVRTHPLLAEVTARGLGQALDGWEKTSAKQTHFVLLDYTRGEYRLRARAHDGMTAQAGVFRRAQTGDRALVPLLAAQLVEQGFAPVGTVTGAGKSVRLTLKGGGLGVPLNRWVKAGNVFAVSRVAAQGAGPRAVPTAWALLELLESPHADGVCHCRYWHRFREDNLKPAPGTLGYRALKLATTHGPVRLRFLDVDTYQPLDGMRVMVRRPGAKDKVELTTNRDGLAVTPAAFAHFAIVHLPSEGVQLPVAIIDSRTVVCRVKVKGGSDTLVGLEYRREAWLRRIYDNVRLASDRARELGQKLGESLPAAEAAARDGLKNMEVELAQLKQEQAALKELAREAKVPPGRFDLGEGAQRLGELVQKQKELGEFVARVEAAIKEGEKNAALGQVLERARLLEREAEFAAAIVLYEKVLKASPDQPKVRAHLDQLKQEWAVKGDAHAAARVFVYDTWPGLAVAGLKKNLKAAHAALADLKAAGDRLTPLKLKQANAAHAANLKTELDRLRRRDTDDNRNQAKVIAEVARDLIRLTEEIAVKKKDGG